MIKVEIEYIGEGWYGDYDEEDPDDSELARFTVMKMNDDGEWEQADDCSYCTQMEYYVLEKENLLDVAAQAIQRRVEGESETRWKKVCEELSWLTTEDIRRVAING